MRALIVPEKGRLEVADLPKPTLTPYEALVKISCCGICNSTDWKIVRGQMPWAGPFPLALGHESIGTVVEVGQRVRKFKVGDRVTRPVYPRRMGINSAFGGFGEFGVVVDAPAMAQDGDSSLLDDYTAQRQNVVPTTVSDEQAVLAISLAETASGLIDLPNLRHKTVVVAGTGIAGLAFTLWCKLAGAQVILLGRRAERLAVGQKVGADLQIDTTRPGWERQITSHVGGPVDGLIEAVGDITFAQRLLPLLKPDGFASAYGAPPDGQAYAQPWVTMNVREHLSYNWVCDLLARGWVRAEWFLSDTFTLDDALGAFERVRGGQVLKALVRL